MGKSKLTEESLASYIPIGIYRFRTTLDNQMNFEYVNQRFCEMLGVTAEEIYLDAQHAFSAIHPDELEGFITLNQEVTRTQQPFSWEGRVIINEEERWLHIQSSPEILEDGNVIWHGVQIDITERKRIEQALLDANALLRKRVKEIEKLQTQLREQAIRDYLTGLFNRRYLDASLVRELARAQRDHCFLTIVLIDIDNFKGINDVYGHQVGDEVLIVLAKLLKESSRVSDIVCRYGGDEFVIVMPNAGEQDAQKRADQWRETFAQKQFTVNQQIFSTTLSIGLATFPHHASSPRGIFQAADEALYRSKKHHNSVTISRRTSTGALNTSID